VAVKSEKIYLAAVKRLFNTPDGIEVLRYWKEEFADPTAVIPGDINMTMYALGKKELVQEFMSHVKEQDVLLDRIKIETEDTEIL
jgi:hypothetical protein